jgi:hypothetical protein
VPLSGSRKRTLKTEIVDRRSRTWTEKMGPTPFQSASATMFVLLSAMRGTQPVQKTGRRIGIMLAVALLILAVRLRYFDLLALQ